MTEPIMSMISSAVRTEYWEELYYSIDDENTIPFEMVFVGNVRPDFDLPDNFIYIYSEAKPIQCFEIACRNAKGKYVMTTQDDLTFPPWSLFNLYKYVLRMRDPDRVMVTPRYHDKLTGEINPNFMFFSCTDRHAPIIGIGTVMSRQLWRDLGGLDRRFHSLFADLDLQLRMYQVGVHPFIAPDVVIRERPHDKYPRLVSIDHSDRQILDSFWMCPGNVTSKERLVSVESFTEDEIPIVR